MLFVDLFAGIGGFHYAVKNVYKNAEVAMVSEIDKFAISTYCQNHKFDPKKVLDIRDLVEKLEKSELKFSGSRKIDLVVGGFPCQTFSKAGKRDGFSDKERGTLFFEVVRIIKVLKPKIILLENVSTLETHDKGQTWKRIRNELLKANYWVPEKPIILSPHSLRLTRQIRKRAFIPGILKTQKVNFKPSTQYFLDVVKSKNFVEISSSKNIMEVCFVSDVQKLKVINAWGEFVKNVKKGRTRTIPVFWLDHLKTKMRQLRQMPVWKKKMIVEIQSFYKKNKVFIDQWSVKHNVSEWNKVQRKLEWQAGIDINDVTRTFLQIRPSGYRFKKKDFYPTLVAMVQTTIFYDESFRKWRYLSVNEVKQLQSFPKSFVENTNSFQALKQFGNSVNVKVVEKVLEKLKLCVAN